MKKLAICVILGAMLCGCQGQAPEQSGQPSSPGASAPAMTEALPEPTPAPSAEITPSAGEAAPPEDTATGGDTAPTSALPVGGYGLQNAPGTTVKLGMSFDDVVKTLKIKGIEYEEISWDDVLGLDFEESSIAIAGDVDERLIFQGGKLNMIRWVEARGNDLDRDGFAMAAMKERGELPLYYMYFERETYRFSYDEITYSEQNQLMDLSTNQWLIYTVLREKPEVDDYEEWERNVDAENFKNVKVFEKADLEYFAIMDGVENPITQQEADQIIEKEFAEAIADEEWPLTYGYGGIAIYRQKPYYFYQLRNLVKDDKGEISHSSYATDYYISLDGKEQLQGVHQLVGLD